MTARPDDLLNHGERRLATMALTRSRYVPQTTGTVHTSPGTRPFGFARLSLYFVCRADGRRTASALNVKRFGSQVNPWIICQLGANRRVWCWPNVKCQMM